ncbi:riboflavin synthase subunit alpha [Undibacterium sp. RTI2.1]|uniref:riboflavin synthase subunit alpha n=1 Tax=unclassified Undibacterium TaxID=2630295 RepID=UPI002B22E762|nr:MULTISPECIES: riboflavin synthase subunit alpha [unclassified Undibacterium]MEB0029454.1 riboflavin synthase subunit alpha [Undibacterium sp. RTI2.1]MEB0115927.1 riboflavin synthase subunit alpha [Undibacterium sp. RTI2.2]MEB0232425.1 riboflavin synthase subunit alpha [Undibacterium sp. 10I3]
MFTGIVQGIARIASITDKPGLRTFTLDFPEGFCEGLQIGASVAVDGVCLTVTSLHDHHRAEFDVMQQSLAITTLGEYAQEGRINVERAARDGAEIGGHPLSGHIDFKATIARIRELENNYVIRIAVPPEWLRYIFAKGYIAINGASLTVAEVNRQEGWFEVWLIPETLRMTVFAEKKTGATLNIEIERATQVVVDTVRNMLAETLGPLLPALEALLKQQSVVVVDLVKPANSQK